MKLLHCHYVKNSSHLIFKWIAFRLIICLKILLEAPLERVKKKKKVSVNKKKKSA